MDRVLIYDGECRFCTSQAATLARLLRPCALESFRQPGVLERYPGITEEDCDQAVQLVLKSKGRVLNRAAAVAYALGRKPLLAPLGGSTWFLVSGASMTLAIARSRVTGFYWAGECAMANVAGSGVR